MSEAERQAGRGKGGRTSRLPRWADRTLYGAPFACLSVAIVGYVGIGWWSKDTRGMLMVAGAAGFVVTAVLGLGIRLLIDGEEIAAEEIRTRYGFPVLYGGAMGLLLVLGERAPTFVFPLLFFLVMLAVPGLMQYWRWRERRVDRRFRRSRDEHAARCRWCGYERPEGEKTTCPECGFCVARLTGDPPADQREWLDRQPTWKRAKLAGAALARRADVRFYGNEEEGGAVCSWCGYGRPEGEETKCPECGFCVQRLGFDPPADQEEWENRLTATQLARLVRLSETPVRAGEVQADGLCFTGAGVDFG